VLAGQAPEDERVTAQSVRLAEALSRAGPAVELELVPGATHFWKGASDVTAIIARSLEFLHAQALKPVDRARPELWHGPHPRPGRRSARLYRPLLRRPLPEDWPMFLDRKWT
jgi:dienelactone hydrolase